MSIFSVDRAEQAREYLLHQTLIAARMPKGPHDIRPFPIEGIEWTPVQGVVKQFYPKVPYLYETRASVVMQTHHLAAIHAIEVPLKLYQNAPNAIHVHTLRAKDRAFWNALSAEHVLTLAEISTREHQVLTDYLVDLILKTP